MTVGRHAASGSDGVDWGDAPVAAGRRRTDGPDGLWSGPPAGGLSDQQTDISRARGDRRRDSLLDSALESGRRPGARPAAGPPAGGTRTPDGARPISRSRLPLPPVPAGPRTTAAPFQAVPSPEISAPAVGVDVLAGVAAPLGAPTDRRRSGAAAAPAAARPGRSWRADERVEKMAALPEAAARGARGSVAAPRVPRQTTPDGGPSAAYGDWTKPSRAELEQMAAADEADYLSSPIGASRLRPAPATSLIPERSVSGRRARRDDIDDRTLDAGRRFDGDRNDRSAEDRSLQDAPSSEFPSTDGPARHGSNGPVTGGRATRRAELQAADQARKEAAKRNGTPIVSPLDEEDGPRRSRVLLGLVAMVVVALGVLGVYQMVSPNADEAASQASAGTTAPAVVPDATALPTLPTTPVVVEPPVAPDAKAPVTVLNATQTTGLAKKIADVMAAAGWQTPAVGAYTGTDIAASTVYFTQGDEAQRQAAVNLVNKFPQLAGPAPRFFDVPADIAAPGLVVVTTGDWKP